MTDLTRRALVAAGATVAAALPVRKPRAQGTGLQDMAALHPVSAPEPVELHFAAADGTARSLADYAGKPVVVNLWATWCVPCVREMAALDELARVLAPQGIAVLPLSSDRTGAVAVQRFYAERGITSLPVLLDPMSAAAHALKVNGIPTTVLFDRTGRQVARLEGAADWAAPGAADAVRAALG